MLDMVRDACLKYLLSPTCSPLGPERVLWDRSHRRATSPVQRLGRGVTREVFLEEVVPELGLTGQAGVDQKRKAEGKVLLEADAEREKAWSKRAWLWGLSVVQGSLTPTQASRRLPCPGEEPTAPQPLTFPF